MIVSRVNIKNRDALKIYNKFVSIVGSKLCALRYLTYNATLNNKLADSRRTYKFNFYCNAMSDNDDGELYESIYSKATIHRAIGEKAYNITYNTSRFLPRFASGIPLSYVKEHLNDDIRY